MDKVARQMLLVAKLHREEISRKVKAQILQASGYVRSQLSGLTSPDRLIECDHYMLKGKQAEMSNARTSLEKAKKELKVAMPEKIKSVKKRDGVTVQVMELLKPR